MKYTSEFTRLYKKMIQGEDYFPIFVSSLQGFTNV